MYTLRYRSEDRHGESREGSDHWEVRDPCAYRVFWFFFRNKANHPMFP